METVMSDVEEILNRLTTNGVRVIKDARIAINIADCNSGELCELIRSDLNGKKGRFETVMGFSAYQAARLAGIGDDEVGEVGDAILDKYPHIVLGVNPADVDGSEPWLIFTFE